MEISIEQIKNFTKDLTSDVNVLLMQLDPNSKSLRDEDVKEILDSSSNYFFAARESVNHKIVGMLILVVYRIPVWKKGWIEDVVVDKEYRGKGIATRLISYAIESAKVNGISSLNLTSRPERENANKLYRKLGFEKRDTNVYRIELQ